MNALFNNVYGELTPKRLIIQSVSRNWYNGSHDAGVWLLGFDSLWFEPLKNIGIDVIDKSKYENFNHYQQPWYFPVDQLVSKSVYINTKYDKMISIIPNEYRMNIKIINQSIEDDGGKLVYFWVSGPSHFTMRIDSTQIMDWSFEIPVFYSNKHHDKTIFMFMAAGYKEVIRIKDEEFNMNQMLDINDEKPVKSEFIFWLKIKPQKPEEFMFMFSAHHINGEYSRNKDKQIDTLKNDIIDKLPNWVDPIMFISELTEVRI